MTVRNVVSYGAVADDATDNNTAFRAACAALVDGDVLYIPAGIYRTTTSPDCPFHIPNLDGIEVRGDGIGASVIKYTSVQGSGGLGGIPYTRGMCMAIESEVWLTYKDGLYVHDVTFEDLNTVYATDQIAALWVRWMKNIHIKSVEVRNAKGGAITLYGGFQQDNLSEGTSILEDCWVHTTGDDGTSNSSGCIVAGFKGLTVRKNRFEERLGRGGIEGWYHENMVIEDNIMKFRDLTDLLGSWTPAQQSGMYALTLKDSTIRNNYIEIESYGSFGIGLQADAVTLPSTRNVLVEGNTVKIFSGLNNTHAVVLQGNTHGAGAGGENVTFRNNRFQGFWIFGCQYYMPDGLVRIENNVLDFANYANGGDILEGHTQGGNGVPFQTNTKVEIRNNKLQNALEPSYTNPLCFPVRWAIWPNAVTNASKFIIEDNVFGTGHPYSAYTKGYGGNVSDPLPEGIYPPESYGTLTIGNITAGATSTPRTLAMLGVLPTDTIECRPDKILPPGITMVYSVGTGTFDWSLKNNTGATINVPANNYRFYAHRANLW